MLAGKHEVKGTPQTVVRNVGLGYVVVADERKFLFVLE